MTKTSKNQYLNCSKFRGVRWHKGKESWEAIVEGTNGGEIIVWYYDSERHAAMARDRKAIELYGKRAKINNYGYEPVKKPRWN